MILGDKTQCRGGFRNKINGATNHLYTKPALPQSFTNSLKSQFRHFFGAIAVENKVGFVVQFGINQLPSGGEMDRFCCSLIGGEGGFCCSVSSD